MAKKRRRPQNRSRNRSAASSTRTTERPRPTAPQDVAPDGRRDPEGPEHKAQARRQRPPSHAPAPGPQRSRAEKKELARAEREAARRRIARAERRRQLAWIAGITVVVAAGVFVFTNRDDQGTSAVALPGELTTEAPWDANAAKSAARATALGLPAEGTTMHEHADVEIFVHGAKEPVPTDIGIDASKGTIQSIHTHDDTGLVHLESSQSREFTLGEFFGVWGVRFTPSCLGAYCNEGNNRLQVFVDGKEVSGSLQDVRLDDQAVIVVTYGTPSELPDPIPSSFDFSSINP
jgi:hypothetical protein